MSKLVSILTITAVVFAFAAVPLFAADTNTMPMKRTETTSPQTPMTTAPSTDMTKGRAANVGKTDFLAKSDRLSDIMDMDVVSRDNKSIGKFEDFIVDRSGKISFAILSMGGLLGVGEKLVPIPFEFVERNVRFNRDKDDLVIDMTQAELEKAPRFESGKLPDLASDQSSSQIRNFFARAGGGSNAMTESRPEVR
jgi:hypothetical protein